MTKLTTGLSNVTTWQYNEYGWLPNKLDANSSSMMTLRYNASGWVTNRNTPAKGDTRYKLDAMGNITNINYAASTDITLKYDAAGRMTNMVDAAGTTVLGYTSVGAVSSENGPWSDDTISYLYNTNRQRSSLSMLQPSAAAWTQTYIYDNADRLDVITTSAGQFA